MVTKFKKVTTVAQAKADPRVSDMYAEFGNIDEGKFDWWIELNENYICKGMECGIIHERTAKECIHLLNTDVVHIDEYNKKFND